LLPGDHGDDGRDGGDDGDDRRGGQHGAQDLGAFPQNSGVGFSGCLFVLGGLGAFLGVAEFGLALFFFGL